VEDMAVSHLFIRVCALDLDFKASFGLFSRLYQTMASL